MGTLAPQPPKEPLDILWNNYCWPADPRQHKDQRRNRWSTTSISISLNGTLKTHLWQRVENIVRHHLKTETPALKLLTSSLFPFPLCWQHVLKEKTLNTNTSMCLCACARVWATKRREHPAECDCQLFGSPQQALSFCHQDRHGNQTAVCSRYWPTAHCVDQMA